MIHHYPVSYHNYIHARSFWAMHILCLSGCGGEEKSASAVRSGSGEGNCGVFLDYAERRSRTRVEPPPSLVFLHSSNSVYCIRGLWWKRRTGVESRYMLVPCWPDMA